MHPNKILAAWERRWGSLPPELRSRFLERDEVEELQQFPEAKVFEAIGKHQRLAMILGEARVLSYWEDRKPPFRPRGDMIHRPGRPEDPRARP